MTERARLTKIGWEEDLAIETSDAPLAEPGGNQVLVEVEACGVCFRDCIDRAGRFKFIQTPITPGHEAVGRVIAIGPNVTDWSVGDRVASTHRDYCGQCEPCKRESGSLCQGAAGVLGLMIDGGYASHLLAPERCFYAMPDDVLAAEAAVLHCTFGTAYRGLARFGGVESGQQVLVTGANGGVGSAAAVQVASRLGAMVTAVTRDESHREYLAGLGAEHVIVDAGDRFHKQLVGRPRRRRHGLRRPPHLQLCAALAASRVGGSSSSGMSSRNVLRSILASSSRAACRSSAAAARRVRT